MQSVYLKRENMKAYAQICLRENGTFHISMVWDYPLINKAISTVIFKGFIET